MMTGWLMWWWTNYTRRGQRVAACVGEWLMSRFTDACYTERQEEG